MTPLLRGYLREQQGFDGVIMSDYAAIEELIAHGHGRSPRGGGLALKAGVDIDMVSGVISPPCPKRSRGGLRT